MNPTTPKATPMPTEYPTPESIREAARSGPVPLSEVVRLFRAQNDDLELSLRMWRVGVRK